MTTNAYYNNYYNHNLHLIMFIIIIIIIIVHLIMFIIIIIIITVHLIMFIVIIIIITVHFILETLSVLYFFPKCLPIFAQGAFGVEADCLREASETVFAVIPDFTSGGNKDIFETLPVMKEVFCTKHTCRDQITTSFSYQYNIYIVGSPSENTSTCGYHCVYYYSFIFLLIFF